MGGLFELKSSMNSLSKMAWRQASDLVHGMKIQVFKRNSDPVWA